MRVESQVTTASSTGSAQDQNLVQLLMKLAQNPSKVGLTHKKNDRWQDVTYAQVLEDVMLMSAGLIAQGVQPGDRVAIFANTSLNWLIADLAISGAQAVTVPIYASNTAEECRYILNHSETKLLLVDSDEKDAKQIGRLSRVRARLGEIPSLQKIVVFEGPVSGEKEMTLADMLASARGGPDASREAFERRVGEVKLEDTNLLIYTSGTTGDPKGVILTHGNWAYEAKATQAMSLMVPNDSVMLFLPLAHVFAQVVKAAWLSMGFRLIIAESVDKLLVNLPETRPTVLPSVPRVFEKVYNNVVANGTSAPGMKGRLTRWAFRQFDEYVEARSQGREHNTLAFALAKKLVFSKVRKVLDEKLGGNMRIFISGGAPLSRKIAYFFDMLDYKVLEGYGLTETSAPCNVNRVEKIKIGTVGPPMPGTEIKIAADGEIMVRGPCLMKGYYKNPAATAEVLEPDGWFHTGDIGELDSDNYLRITDRKKDIIVTAGGKNVAPQNIENTLKTFPLISQAMVYGDKRPFLVALITVSEEPARKLLEDKGIAVGTYAQNSQRPEIKAAVEEIIKKVNAEIPPYSSIKKIAVMDADFTQESGELTPTLKVKRKVASQKYIKTIDAMYEGAKVMD
ncbi:putative long-chain-fatty-acid--CoA ligase [Corallococcus coralloides DSM 2259]|uniref:Putative long-chain-fatty-acid--CoA ligase n=1 Tax=Corallococcus coralloides (strain ATCC 25202 / DSM 2259 / NBRC 100086 / M2) TaxID=1144275 RepID=H8MRC2_CORCM|nr:AMP-dependent synthetase/ligase [Corallococcus coralloides]AFE08728.1 putative long-chain-fatty-acid--CoA ligase [Corallococcus coralloides DSM 2259]